MIRAGGALQAGLCPLYHKDPTGQGPVCLLPKAPGDEGTHLSSSPWMGLGQGAPPWRAAWPVHRLLLCPFSLPAPSRKPLRRGWGWGSTKPQAWGE